MFQPPANLGDLADLPDLKTALLDLWNLQSPDLRRKINYMGDFTTIAAGNRNYVDPRQEPATGAAAAVPWNGFPRLLSRFYQDATSEAARARAEEVADILTPELYWFEQVDGGYQLQAASPHELPLYTSNTLDLALLRQIARPLRELLADGNVGDEILQFRRQQDEYLEWHVDRAQDGNIRRISFTAEPPDYWRALAEVAPDRVVKLYQDHVDSQIQKADIFYPPRVAIFGRFEDGTNGWLEVTGYGGRYNPLNPWTTTQGIMHLTHGANTLGAEVNLAGQASVARPVDALVVAPGQDPAPEIVRIACGNYGGINRSSDPNIGIAVGKQVQAGNRITLTDPVGLYISRIDLSGLSGPNGEALSAIAGHVTRGTDDPFEPRILRFEVKLPAGSSFTLSDCRFDNRPLVRGGQIARESTIQLYVNVYAASSDTTPSNCLARPCRHPDNQQIFGFTDNAGNCEGATSLSWLLSTPYEGGDGGSGAGIGLAPAWEEPERRVTRQEEITIPPKTGYAWNKRNY